MMSNPNEPQEGAPSTVKKGSVSAAISSAVAEVLASHFVKAVTSLALGGIVSTSEVKSATEVKSAAVTEAPDHTQPASVPVSCADAVAAAHPQTCGRQVQAGLHAYERD